MPILFIAYHKFLENVFNSLTITIPLTFVRKILLGLLSISTLVSCTKNYQGNEKAWVHIKKEGGNYTLYKNGSPFYIQGASGDSHFQELQEIGGNTIRVYDTVGLRKTLDQAHIAKLSVIVDLHLPNFTPKGTFYQNNEKVQQLLNSYRELITKHASHPALLAWNLGNEINYPFRPKYQYFYTAFNDLIKMIHQKDPNHPVTTTLSRDRLLRRIFSLQWHSPDLDFISINIFGKLKDLQEDINTISWFWNGPYLLSEWGINGPWETPYTSWQAPIESTSTKKAEQLKERYEKYIAQKRENNLGNLVFYWGHKQECTHTWYSFFDTKGNRSPMVQELQKLWTQKPVPLTSPQIEYMLLDQKGALDNCLFKPGTQKKAEIKFKNTTNDSLKIYWELFPENWGYNLGGNQYTPPAIKTLAEQVNQQNLIFETPQKEGAYRLFAYIYDNHGNVASANTPFYVLKTADD